VSLSQTAENVAARCGVWRQEQDEFALLSQQKTDSAMRQGLLSEDMTAGNSSGINVSAAMLLVTSADGAPEFGLEPLASVVSTAVAGVAGVRPDDMGLGPTPASRKVLQRAGLSIGEMDIVEVNEAFASQAIASLEDVGVDSPRSAASAPMGATSSS